MKKSFLPLMAGFSTSLAIGLLSYLDAALIDISMLMAPFGATAVLVFGISGSPLAQPKNVILGHLITSFIGVFFFQFIDVSPLSLAIATGLGVSVMLLSRTTHPPAGANPLLIMLSGQDWIFLITPVLIGTITMVFVGKVMQIFQRHIALEF